MKSILTATAVGCHEESTPCAAGILMDTSPGEIGRVLVGPAVVIAVPVVAGSIRKNVLRIVQIPRKNKTFFVDADQLTCRAEAMEVKAAPQATIEVSCMFDEYEELLDLDGSEFLRAGAEVAMKA